MDAPQAGDDGEGREDQDIGRRDSARADADRKAFTTLQAKAALRGVALIRCFDEAGQQVFLASRWNLTRQFATLANVEAFLAAMGGGC
jgi:hypothetical protein